MARSSPQSFEKRQRERRKREKRAEKLERRQIRQEEKRRALEEGDEVTGEEPRASDAERAPEDERRGEAPGAPQPPAS